MVLDPDSNAVGNGLKLSQTAIARFRDAGFNLRAGLRLRFQGKSRRWVMMGDEQGGAAGNLAHYVGFVGVGSPGLIFSLPVHSFTPNVVHRRVAAQDLVRFEISRYESSCDVFIARHYLEFPDPMKRPLMRRQVLFSARAGAVTEATEVPLFFDGAGEQIEYPKYLLPGLKVLAHAAYSRDCDKALMLVVPPIVAKDLPPLRLRVGQAEHSTAGVKSDPFKVILLANPRKKKKNAKRPGMGGIDTISVPNSGTSGD